MLAFQSAIKISSSSSGHPNTWTVYCLCRSSSNNTYINPSYKDLMKFVPGTFRWLMYLSPFTLPPTCSCNQLCNSCLHRCSACPSPHGHGHVFMLILRARQTRSQHLVPSIYSKALQHSCTTCLESYHKI